ncbi:MAG: ATP-binding protein [Acidobacteriota bacterium]
MHGCPCGFYGDTTRECRCPPAIIQRYLSKVSGPLLDRIDLHIEVPAVHYKELRGPQSAASTSAEIRARVEQARRTRQARGWYNSQLPTRLLRRFCQLDESGERTLEMAVRRLGLSARAHDRILKVARTIAALDASVSAKHLAEAVRDPAPSICPWRPERNFGSYGVLAENNAGARHKSGGLHGPQAEPVE